MTSFDDAVKEIVELRKLLMEADHILSLAKNRGICNERLKERIQRHLERKDIDIEPASANLTTLI